MNFSIELFAEALAALVDRKNAQIVQLKSECELIHKRMQDGLNAVDKMNISKPQKDSIKYGFTGNDN